MPEARRPSAVRVVVAATLAMLVAAWPPFLVAVLALSMSSIGVDTTVVAIGVAAFFVLAAALSPLGGRIVGRIGPPAALRIVAGGSFLACTGLAAAPSPPFVLAALAGIGALNALVQPATNAMIRAGVPARGRGLSFGIVQAAIPLTVVAAGALVPLVGSTGTWRAAFVAASLVCLVTIALIPAMPTPEEALRASSRSVVAPAREWRGPELGVLALAAGAAAASATALGTLAATAGVGVGLTTDVVAVAVAVMGLTCAGLRALAGRAAALRPNAAAPTGLLVMMVLFLTGAGGFVVLAVGDAAWFGLGVLLAYGFGWAWTGVLNLVVSSRVRDVARATGRTQIGVLAGCASGPLLLALIAGKDEAMRLSWAVAASLMIVALCCAGACGSASARGVVRVYSCQHPPPRGRRESARRWTSPPSSRPRRRSPITRISPR